MKNLFFLLFCIFAFILNTNAQTRDGNADLLWTGNHNDGVWSVSFSPDGSKVVSGSQDKTVR
ncbi:MAG: WD40 repeat domain-containing protein, partial [Bacteroidota bacterium]